MTGFKLFLCLILPCFHYGKPAVEDNDVLTRDPYQYQFKVDDPETSNRYEIAESGDPDIVQGSYRIALPDGRTQVVTYEVHPEKGFDAKVTYEGVAQYPDSPGYVPSAYGPPEPIRPGYAKYKRQSQAAQPKKKLGKKVREHRKVTSRFNKNKIVEKSESDLITASSDQHHFPSKTVEESPSHNHNTKHDVSVKTEFDDTEIAPQAEPLSLRQSKPVSTTKRPLEYKPPSIFESIYGVEDKLLSENRETELVTNNQYVSTPSLVIHEAVPTGTDVPEVYHINYVSGYAGPDFASPQETSDDVTDTIVQKTADNVEKVESSESNLSPEKSAVSNEEPLINHELSNLKSVAENVESVVVEFIEPELPTKSPKKRKIDTSDYYKTEEILKEKPLTVGRLEFYEPSNILPTIYRSQINYLPSTNAVEKIEENKRIINTAGTSITVTSEDQNSNAEIKAADSYKLAETNDTTYPQEEKEKITIDEPIETKAASSQQKPNKPFPAHLHLSVREKGVNNNPISEKFPPITTHRPRYRIIRRARANKVNLPAPLSPRKYKPAPRNREVKLVYKEEGFVPEYVPRF